MSLVPLILMHLCCCFYKAGDLKNCLGVKWVNTYKMSIREKGHSKSVLDWLPVFLTFLCFPLPLVWWNPAVNVSTWSKMRSISNQYHCCTTLRNQHLKGSRIRRSCVFTRLFIVSQGKEIHGSVSLLAQTLTQMSQELTNGRITQKAQCCHLLSASFIQEHSSDSILGPLSWTPGHWRDECPLYRQCTWEMLLEAP